VNLTVNIGGLSLTKPILTASGCFGYGEEYSDLVDPSSLGAIITKGISLQPRKGNPPPRIAETPAGMLNSVGLENIGVKAFINTKLPSLRERGITVLVNLYGESAAEYRKLAEKMNQADGVSGLEINISCPNVDRGGVEFGQHPESTFQVIRSVREVTSLPLLAKLSPNVGDIVEIARAAAEGGADGVTLINTLRGMVIDVRTRRPKLARRFGGLSGPAIRPVAVRMVYEVAHALPVPIVGVGGITSTEAALEFFIAGASAVQIGTGLFLNPDLPRRVLEGIKQYLKRERLNDIRQLIGSGLPEKNTPGDQE